MVFVRWGASGTRPTKSLFANEGGQARRLSSCPLTGQAWLTALPRVVQVQRVEAEEARGSGGGDQEERRREEDGSAAQEDDCNGQGSSPGSTFSADRPVVPCSAFRHAVPLPHVSVLHVPPPFFSSLPLPFSFPGGQAYAAAGFRGSLSHRGTGHCGCWNGAQGALAH